MIMIADWAKSKAVTKFLQEKLKIPRVPCYSQFANIMGIINGESLNAAFTNWVNSMIEIYDKTIAIDGKTVRSTEKMLSHAKPNHIVSAYISEL